MEEEAVFMGASTEEIMENVNSTKPELKRALIREYWMELFMLVHIGVDAFYDSSKVLSAYDFEQHADAKTRHCTLRPNSVMKRKGTADAGTKKRDNFLHQSLFMPKGLPDGAELAYFVKGQKLIEGYKQGSGIVCGCCERELSPSQFEAHAGMADRRQPYRHVRTSNGLTLHDIALSLSNGQRITTDIGDDMCSICGDSGDLLFCHECCQAVHPACLNLGHLPEGDWHCANCADENGLGRKAVSGESSRIARPIVIRLTRVVKAPEFEIGGCAICREYDFSSTTFDDRTIIFCDQVCAVYSYYFYPNRLFLRYIIIFFFCPFLVRRHLEKGLFIDEATDCVQWCILNGKSHYPEDLPLLSSAAAIFQECFDPIVANSGCDLIPAMVYGRSISGQEFGGMYCVVLIVRSVVVSAGLLRIFGREIAELPVVATTREHQGKGYFQALFACIERFLSSLNVESLMLPAAEEALSIWTEKFGFTKMKEEQLQVTVFKGTSVLVKKVQQIPNNSVNLPDNFPSE
ncbi:hypothetical protein PVK06_031942 [Gossypium arboreum]|uniref:PHD-type domain-containing protein n=1 Tax=Gossypium arboreum TaxID=29729 RepID=A0ABR0NVT0_GOSAR|nr:hypothetical protein PVK06_031942 [Gossypium arboreum]